MELSAVRERILSTPLVKSLPEEMRQRFVMILLWISKTEDVSREHLIFKEGDKDTDEGCLILEGMVRIITEESDKKTIEAPDILGEVQLFTPKRTRTATVEVIVGGQILSFGWHDFGAAAQEFYNEDEMAALKKVISDSAWTREDNLFEKVQRKSQ